MGDLSKNPLWNNVSPAQSASFMGPDYSYADNVPGPSSLGVGSNGTFSQVYSNLNAVQTYVKGLISGDPPLGNQYFINTGGVCTASDGSTQPRWNYINNIPGGGSPPAGIQDLAFLSNDMRGIIPGIVQDVEGLNPYYLFSALTSDGTPTCECYKCPVTAGSDTYFLTPDLSPDFDPDLCTQVDVSQCKSGGSESFSNMSEFSPIPTLIAVVGILFLTLK
jgi:hypothetical protein